MNKPIPNGRRKVLVMGASGFVGSHVTRQLVERGDDVRVYLRKSSSTVAIDDLDVERCYGDFHDEEALRAAMSDRDVVFYCVVDTRFLLRDPSPLFETNVEESAAGAGHCNRGESVPVRLLQHHRHDRHRRGKRTRSTEDVPFNWHGIGGAYIESRRQAEDMVLAYARERGLPAVVMCVSNPYGPLDWQPNQGLMVKMAAFGKMPVYVKGVSTEVVGVEDVAAAFLLAGDRGRVGERYIVSESYMSMREMFETAASAVGAKPPRLGVPVATLYVSGRPLGCGEYAFRRDFPMNVTGVRLLHITSPADHGKATRSWMEAPSDRRIDPTRRAVLRRAGPGARIQKPDLALALALGC